MIKDLQSGVQVRDEQIMLMTKAIEEYKQNSHLAVATKQVHDKISQLTVSNQQLIS